MAPPDTTEDIVAFFFLKNTYENLTKQLDPLDPLTPHQGKLPVTSRGGGPTARVEVRPLTQSVTFGEKTIQSTPVN